MSNWDDLKVFLAVARAESLSGAGRVLKLDPATVGRRIARLEEATGAPLFAKSPQGYALTNEGHRLMTHALRAEQEMIRAFEDLAGQEGQLTGTIRLGAPDGCANFVLPQVCEEILKRNPELEIQIVSLPRVFNLSRREADIAIGVSPPTARQIHVEKLTDYKLHLVASTKYLRRSAPIETVADLGHHQIVGYVQDMIFDSELDYLAEAGLDKVHLASNSVSVQFNWIRHGAGIGIMHEFAMPFARGLTKVLEEEVQLTRSFYLIRHVDDMRLERLNRFAEALADGVRREVSWLESLN